jgi:hypothetical protein
MSRRLAHFFIGAALCGCAAAPSSDESRLQSPPSSTSPASVPDIRPGFLAGYLGRDLPDSLLLLPAPPAENIAAFEQDQSVSRASQRLRDTPRYAQATADADLSFPRAASAFACALGLPIAPERSPHLALILTELAPDRADALLARGRSFGESRLICNAHWQSDVLEGRAVAAGTVAKLHADTTFKADLAAAEAEVAALRRSGLAPNADCDAEAAAMSVHIDGVL